MENKSYETPPPYYVEQRAPPPGFTTQQPQAASAPLPPTVIAMQPPQQPQVTTINVNTQPVHGGTCPVCHHGRFEGSFTLCGWLCCIFCFPIGIICCLCMRKKKCSHCGFSAS